MKARFLIAAIAVVAEQICLAYSFEEDGFYYQIDQYNPDCVGVVNHITDELYESHYVSCDCDGSLSRNGAYSGNIVVPSRVVHDGVEYKVTRIGVGAFSGSENLRSVVLPPSINYICDAAFSDCHALEAVEIQGKIKSISFKTFRQCTSLKKLDLSNVTQYVDICIGKGQQLTELILPPNASYYSIGLGGLDVALTINNPEPPCPAYILLDNLGEDSSLSVPPGNDIFTWYYSGWTLNNIYVGAAEHRSPEADHSHQSEFNIEGQRVTALTSTVTVHTIDGRLIHTIVRGKSVSLDQGIFIIKGAGTLKKIAI